jgi:carboxypeptidase C (cathepsin A)
MLRRSIVLVCTLAVLACALPARAQRTAPSPQPSAAAAPVGPIDPARERSVVTHHELHLAGKTLAYTAHAGTLILRNDKDEPAASVFYTAYTVDGERDRPVTFAYNGGPGSSSMWLHIGSIGPKRLVTNDGQPNGGAPYRVIDNPNTLLDTTDIVFIDAVGTGYSTVLPKGSGKDYWGVNEDIRAFDQFIRRWTTVNDRWNSPKYLFGESYGTFRSAGLANALQDDGLALSGVTILSTVLDYATLSPGPGGEDLADVLFFPTEAAVAWYHNAIPNRPADLATFVANARAFAMNEYAPALMRVAPMSAAERTAIVAKIHAYLGLDPGYIDRADLRITPGRFEKELLRAQGKIVGRLDGRYTATDGDRNATQPEFDATDVAITGAYTSAFIRYSRDDLNWKSDVLYKPTNYGEVNRGWNFARGNNRTSAPETVDDLRQAMTKNPKLRLFSAAGYFDLATPFFGMEYSLAHLGLDPSLRGNISYGYYPTGHMVYINAPAAAKFHDDLVRFYSLRR